MTAGPALDLQDLHARAWDLAEAIVVADAVGDDDRAHRYLAELRALALPPGSGDGTLAAALDEVGALATGQPGPSAIPGHLVPGPVAAAHALGIGPGYAVETAPGHDGHRWHLLKVWPGYWPAVASGAKPFELRRNDRAYEAGDRLLLAEWRPSLTGGAYTGRRIARPVTYVVTAADLLASGLEPMLAEGVACLGLGHLLPAAHVAAAAHALGLRSAAG